MYQQQAADEAKAAEAAAKKEAAIQAAAEKKAEAAKVAAEKKAAAESAKVRAGRIVMPICVCVLFALPLLNIRI